MVSLRHFTAADLPVLRDRYGGAMTDGELLRMIGEWNTGDYNGRVFEMFAILNDGRVTGSISLYEHSPSVASLGPEVFPGERRKGFAAEAMRLLMRAARERGYRVLQQQIRADNTASRRLHEALGFETDGYLYRNRKDQSVLLYWKAL